jgi:hypothetical protein
MNNKNLALEKQVIELRAKCESEKNAKNKAYDFIISFGLLELFKEFCLDYKGDGFENCKKHLICRLNKK